MTDERAHRKVAISSTSYDASIIVPAFNEQDRIGPLLPVLSEVARAKRYLVVVACNGCTDRTADMARATEQLEVLEIARASKSHALNVADDFASDVFPRLYVDADVRTDARSLSLLVEALRGDAPLAVRPSVSYLEEGAPWLVRAMYESRTAVPSSRQWLDEHIEGHHVYGTNAAGRLKFDVFPEEGQMMEDAFFDRMFDRDEKRAVLEARVEVPLPDSTRGLVRGMTRIYQGNWELTSWLRAHRPDRLPIARIDPPVHRSMRERIHYYASGGSMFESWSPRNVVIALATLSLRAVASRTAKRHVRAGRQSAWR